MNKNRLIYSLITSALLTGAISTAAYAQEVDEVIIVEEMIVPATQAKKSYAQAVEAYMHKEYAKAKSALASSEKWIKKSAHSVDTKVSKEMQKLKRDIQNLKNKILPESSIVPTDLKGLSMTDYKVTDTFFDEAYVNGQFALTSPANDQNDTSYNGSVNANYKLRNMTIDYAQDLRVDGNYNISKSSDKESDSEDSYNILASGHVDKYLLDVNPNFLLYGSGTVGYRKLIGQDADDPYLSAGVGVGYGRIYDATPYAKAIRVLQDLQEKGIVQANISKSMVMDLAAIIAKEDEYVSKYSAREYKKYWFDAMSKLFQKDGATSKPLDAFGIIRIEEILVEDKIFPRYHGWIVRAGVGQIISNYNNHGEDPTVDAEFEYGLPVGLRGQFYEQAKYSALLSGDTGHKFTNTMTYSYELGELIDWENKWIFDYYKPSDSNLEDITTNSLSTTFSYYLTNQLSFDTTLTLNNVDDGIDNNGNDDWETKLFTGVSYRLK